MTIREFMIVLGELNKKNREKFQFFLGLYVRISPEDMEKISCPLTFVCYKMTGKFFPPFEWNKAAKLICLSEKAAEKIANAADGPSRGKKTTRKALLMALNLKEMGEK